MRRMMEWFDRHPKIEMTMLCSVAGICVALILVAIAMFIMGGSHAH